MVGLLIKIVSTALVVALGLLTVVPAGYMYFTDRKKKDRTAKVRIFDTLCLIGMGSAYIAAIYEVVKIWNYDGFTNANINELVILSFLLALTLGSLHALATFK